MSWIAITEAHLTDRLSGLELAAWRKAALADNQEDPVAGIFASVTDEVRGYVGAYRANSLNEGSTIPSELLDTAIALVIARLVSRLPIALSEERKAAKNEALDRLRDVAAGRFRVPTAETPVVTYRPVPAVADPSSVLEDSP